MESNVCSDEGSFRDYELRDLNLYGVTAKCVRPSKSRKRALANDRCRLTDQPAATTRNKRLVLEEILVAILTPRVTQIHVSRLHARIIGGAHPRARA